MNNPSPTTMKEKTHTCMNCGASLTAGEALNHKQIIVCQPSEVKPSVQQECTTEEHISNISQYGKCKMYHPYEHKPSDQQECDVCHCGHEGHDCPVHKPSSSTDTALLQAIEYLLSDEGKKKIIELVEKLK